MKGCDGIQRKSKKKKRQKQEYNERKKMEKYRSQIFGMRNPKQRKYEKTEVKIGDNVILSCMHAMQCVLPFIVLHMHHNIANAPQKCQK